MAVYFNADEVFEMAEEIERNGVKFYRRAAECVSSKDHKNVLLELAAMEDDHQKTFAAMRAKLAGSEKEGLSYDPNDEGAMYLQAMADGYVFDAKADACARLTGKESMADILKTAIGLEKESIVFYLGLKGMVPEWLGKDKIDAIIKEELGHIATLSGKLKSLSA